MPPKRRHPLLIYSLSLISLMVLSGINTYDRTTWVLEVFPVMIALPLVWSTYRRFPLTGLVYCLIFIHACVLMVGGTYTYARVPVGFQIAEWFNLSRNPYDKFGHFLQGFVPALIAREILIRGQFVSGNKMLKFIVICIILAISAVYELIEWGAALALGQGADEFLGMQGYIWDTQSDMFFALIGAVIALTLFTGIHDRQIQRIQVRKADSPLSNPP